MTWTTPRNTVQHLTTAPSPYVITVNAIERPRCNVVSTDPCFPTHVRYFDSIEEAREYGEAFATRAKLPGEGATK